MTEHITFALESGRRVDGENAIYPMSLLFKAGEYKDKSYAMTGDEIRAAVEGFAPIGGNIEHTNFLKGRACQVRRVWAEGDTLKGEVAVPLGLDALLTDDERKLSCEWNRDTKTLTGIALCMKPRVSDAALMTELAGDDAGALEDALVLMAGKRHSKTDQHLINTAHTMTHAVGQILVGLGAQPTEGSAAEEAGESPSQEAAETTAGMSKGAHGMADEQAPQTPKAPTPFDKFMAWFAGEPSPTQEGEGAAMLSTTTPHPVTKGDNAERAAQRENEALKARIAAMEQQGIHDKACAFAETMVVEKRAVPAERETIIAAFKQAGNDDLAHPQTVTFSDGSEHTRLDVMRAQYTGRPAHLLTEEVLKDPKFAVLFAEVTKPAKTEETLTEEEHKRLLSLTPIGRTALAERNGR